MNLRKINKYSYIIKNKAVHTELKNRTMISYVKSCAAI